MTQAFQLSILTFSSKNAGQYANLWMGLLAVKGGKIHLSTFEAILNYWYDSEMNKIVTSFAGCFFFANHEGSVPITRHCLWWLLLLS